MLINCPRCGFQQPEDKYCAQCGVDMENYKPSVSPIWKRFFGNLAVQLSLLVFIAGSVGIVLYEKGQQKLERRAGQLSSPIQISRTTDSSNSDSVAAVSETQEASEIQPSEAENQSDKNKDEVGLLSTSSTIPTTADKTSDKTKTEARAPANINTPHLKVYYAEVSRRSLNSIFAASRTTGQFMNFNDYSAGILPSIDKALNDSQVKVLNKEERTLDSAKTLQWFYGLKDRQNPEMEIGLTTFFELNDIEGGNLRGNLEIQRTWREATGSGSYEVQRKSFPAIFEIGGETGFFISGVMPLQSNLENDDELTSIEVYKILRSTQFRAGESEFVIFIKFEKGN